MANRPRAKMPPSQRAKQFLPFAAVKGLDEAIAKKERELYVEQRTELPEEMNEMINTKLARLHKGDIVSVTYFRDGEYLSICGAVAQIDSTNRILCISTTKISLDDISDMHYGETRS